ncbi:hypothetical protein PHLGIDRAFT_120929 [Phlebiopsis gigantea 11061_1 CR5-6]|uniref:Uncharacterized protein n=1 Tax=Phlebiopsis gigantea (strain 11061_1 CR5-6) TaxID=745531 RepID=A0A0C3RTS2_PHLG1|nr:hypothetical protein PHLGIDRAFT_120929 [Phlebiopsis gigantea 11061_1 CR5-6]
MESTEQPDEAEADLLISSKNADDPRVDSVSSARSTYNTSPVEEEQVPTPIGGKQGIDRSRPPAQLRPIQDSPNTQLASRRQPVHPHSSPSHGSGDLPPSYENVIAQRQANV